MSEGTNANNTNLLQTTLGPLLQAGTLQTILEYLAKGGAVAGTAYLVENVRGQVKSAFVRSVLQAVIFAVLLFLIDYVVPRVLPLLGGATESVAAPALVDAEGFADYEDDSYDSYDY